MAPPFGARLVTALLCLTTCPDSDTAQRIADALVEERLAACVNFLPGMHSTYRWKGKVERADEVLLLIKTTRVRLPAVQERIVGAAPLRTARKCWRSKPAACPRTCSGSREKPILPLNPDDTQFDDAVPATHRDGPARPAIGDDVARGERGRRERPAAGRPGLRVRCEGDVARSHRADLAHRAGLLPVSPSHRRCRIDRLHRRHAADAAGQAQARRVLRRCRNLSHACSKRRSSARLHRTRVR